MGWYAGSPDKAYAQGMSDAIYANKGNHGVFEITYKPPKDYPDAYTKGWDAHYRK